MRVVRFHSYFLVCAFMLIVSTGIALCQPQNGVDSVIVAITRIDHNSNMKTCSLTVEWAPFKVISREGYDNCFDEYRGDLSYTLKIREGGIEKKRINDVSSTRYTFPVTMGKEYSIEVNVQTGDNFIDVSQEILSDSDMPYNKASMTLKIDSEPLIRFTFIKDTQEFIVSFLRYGKYLGISYILFVILIFGFLLCIIFVIKLFFLPENRIHTMRKDWSRITSVGDIESTLVEQRDRKTILNSILPLAIEKFRKYPHVGRKMGRIDRVIDTTTKEEIVGFMRIETKKLRGLTSKRLWNFFFSMEFFWNFGVIAPILGLLGTVTGISKAFFIVNAISSYAVFSDLVKRLSVGINEALYTTLGGLIIGIPFLGLYFLFNWRTNKIINEVNLVINKVLRTLEREW